MRPLQKAIRLDGVLLYEVDAADPPTPEDLQALLDYAGGSLPDAYLDIIRRYDGLCAWFGGPEARTDGYLSLDSCQSILETAESFGLREQGSTLLPVGGDGGGECFGLDFATGEWVVAAWTDLGSGNDEWRYPNFRAMLEEFLEHLDDADDGLVYAG